MHSDYAACPFLIPAFHMEVSEKRRPSIPDRRRASADERFSARGLVAAAPLDDDGGEESRAALLLVVGSDECVCPSGEIRQGWTT